MHRRFNIKSPAILKTTIGLLITSTLIFVGGCSNDLTNLRLPDKNLLLPDINPHPLSDIKDGGQLSLPIETFPSNFNYNQLNGAAVDLYTMNEALMPTIFANDSQGNLFLDKDYVTNANEQIVNGTQTINYTINPKAEWSDGTPITYKDFYQSYIDMSGKDPSYQQASTSGYNQIKSVTEGIDAKHVIVTMDKPFGDWKSLFSPLYPAKYTDTPEKFNNGWINGYLATSGPFEIKSIDATKQVVQIVKNPNWWGTPAKLDQITFIEISSDQGIDPYLTGEVNMIGTSSNAGYIEQGLKAAHTRISRSLTSQWFHLDFNGAVNRITSDPVVRQAIARSINRKFLQYLLYRTIEPKDTPLINNHIYIIGQTGYKSNAPDNYYDPKYAEELLNKDGWKIGSNGIRVKNGKPLNLQFVLPTAGSATDSMYLSVQNDLKKIGVNAIINQVTGDSFFPNYITVGNFDLTIFIWGATPFPITNSFGVYYFDPNCANPKPQIRKNCNVQQNYGGVGNEEVNNELTKDQYIIDPKEQIKALNQTDSEIWQEMPSLPLIQTVSATLVDSRLANIGSTLFEATDFTKVGWLKDGK